MGVYASVDEKIGTVSDILVDDQGHFRYFVVDLGSTYHFRNVIKKEERFDLTICNPPFHASFEEAQSGTLRKLSNLNHKRITKPTLNFGGQNKELW
ncbi:MAG: RlmF-related methyltransferase, partial [Nostocales cyanobacterium W4_Combined_metabat2_030]|nr:RlmF-related methyltransferase [Nostocales cyanobacterium W4_Combined_metabat2_030]